MKIYCVISALVNKKCTKEMSVVWIVMKIEFLLPCFQALYYECIMRHYGKCINIPNLGIRWQWEISCTYQWQFMSFFTELEAVWASEVMLSELVAKSLCSLKSAGMWCPMTHCHSLELLNVQECECGNIRQRPATTRPTTFHICKTRGC